MNMHFDYPIIDTHGHLGDILYPNSGDLIDKTGIRPKEVYDPVALSERNLHRSSGPLDRLMYKVIGRKITIAEREKNFAATLENLAESLEDMGIGAGLSSDTAARYLRRSSESAGKGRAGYPVNWGGLWPGLRSRGGVSG